MSQEETQASASGQSSGSSKRGAFVYATGRDTAKLERVAVVFLASDQPYCINGIELTVDGGQTQVYAGHN